MEQFDQRIPTLARQNGKRTKERKAAEALSALFLFD
jgi:hypothetical protein